MQNLPITIGIQSAIPAQTPNSTANNTQQISEPFSSVLARQRTHSGEKDARDKGQAASSATGNAPLAKDDEPEAPTPDTTSILPGDMLAALLPIPANANGSTTDEKPASHDPSPDGVNALPSDMLAALLSTPVVVAGTGAPEQTGVGGAQSTTLQQSIANELQGGTRQELIAAGTHAKTAISPFDAQSIAMSKTAATDVTQGKTFSTVMETLGKDAATNALSAGAAQTSAQAALPDAIALSGLMQGNTLAIAAQNGPAQVAVNTPVTHDSWGDEFNQKITWIATQHEQTAELHLNPPHLGPLDVVLKISGDQATALFTSPHAAVRDAVEQALPKLREMLADNGIMLGNAMVNDQSPREQQPGMENKKHAENVSLLGKAGDAVPASGTVWPARRQLGMVDTFA